MHHTKGDKFTEHIENDFQEWEQYDIVYLEMDGNNSFIKLVNAPSYIHDDIKAGANFQ